MSQGISSNTSQFVLPSNVKMELPKDHPSFCHFIHEHPLEPFKGFPSSQEVSCSGCGLRVSAENSSCCSCNSCGFFLHGLCSSFPSKIRHNSHPDHSLVLASAPEDAGRPTGVCRACENLITGFYYSCTACEVSYHPLCLSLPFSISINCHPHSLGLEFSLSYEFRCDMCNKPSYRGWLYRCGRCEFDVHLGCAFSRITKLETTNFSIGNIPCDETTGRELTRLLMDKFVNVEKSGGRSPASGWIEIAKTPGGTNFMKGARIVSPTNGEQTQFVDDKSVLLETSTTPSYQFSDAYFSIDLAKSYSGGNNNNNGKSPLGMAPGVPEAKDKIGLISTVTPSVIAGLSDRERKQLRRYEAIGTENYGQTKNDAVGNGGRKSDRRDNVVDHKGNKVADTDIGWKRLFFGCCDV